MRYMMFLLAIVVSVVLTATLIASVDDLPTAEAAKASGVKTQQYGKNAETLICGDHPCVANSSVSQGVSSPTSVPDSTNLDAIFQKMDKIYKQHQAQIREKWISLDSSEKIRFSQKMHDVMEKMESMNMGERMEKMMSGNYEHNTMKGSHGEYDKAKGERCDKDSSDKKGRSTEKK